MNSQEIRTMALCRGLSPHQADVAVEVFGLLDAAGRCRGTLLPQPSGPVPPMCKPARVDAIVIKALIALDDSLSLQLHDLGLSLAAKIGDLHVRDWISRQVTMMTFPVDTDTGARNRPEVAGAVIEMARTAPARKPVPRPYTPHRWAVVAPYWAGLDGDLLWAPGVVL